MMGEYAERDIMALDRQGNYYSRHLSAMTGEKLHDKSDIAAELAWRDAQIAALTAHVDRLREGLHHALVLWGPFCPQEEGVAYMECEKRCDETPAISLAQRKAQWQAEALENAAGDAPVRAMNATMFHWLRNEARLIRIQAEEASNAPTQAA